MLARLNLTSYFVKTPQSSKILDPNSQRNRPLEETLSQERIMLWCGTGQRPARYVSVSFNHPALVGVHFPECLPLSLYSSFFLCWFSIFCRLCNWSCHFLSIARKIKIQPNSSPITKKNEVCFSRREFRTTLKTMGWVLINSLSRYSASPQLEQLVRRAHASPSQSTHLVIVTPHRKNSESTL